MHTAIKNSLLHTNTICSP